LPLYVNEKLTSVFHVFANQKREMSFKHLDILTNIEKGAAYIKALSSCLPLPLKALVAKAHELAPEIKTFCDSKQLTAKLSKDKGLTGKKVEFYIFGRLPNSESTADTAVGDVKATHIKKQGALGHSAKERLTLTNCGSTGDYDTLQHIVDSPSLEQSTRYCKIQTGILCVLEHDAAVTDDMDEIVHYLFRYDITELPATIQTVIAADYQKIRQRVIDKDVSQSGQTYLHIHPHGSGHGSTTRAFGFTNKFVTTLIAHYGEKALMTKGRSLYF